jgi:hypothetical protein
MRLRTAIAGLLLATSATTVTGLPAQAADPALTRVTTCGQTMTGDAYLARDLTCDTGVGIRLEAPADAEDGSSASATLDLRGHRLRGSGTGFGVYVDLYPATGDLRLENGRVDHWEHGVLEGSGTLTVRRVRIDGNAGRGVWCNGTCLIDRSLIQRNGTGVFQAEADVALTRSLVLGNGVGSELLGITSGSFSRNVYARNRTGVLLSGGTVHLRRNWFIANRVGVTGPPGDHIDYFARIERNVFRWNRNGVYLPAPSQEPYLSYHELSGNTAVRNARYGFYAPGATDLGGNTAAANGGPCVGVVCHRR